MMMQTTGNAGPRAAWAFVALLALLGAGCEPAGTSGSAPTREPAGAGSVDLDPAVDAPEAHEPEGSGADSGMPDEDSDASDPMEQMEGQTGVSAPVAEPPVVVPPAAPPVAPPVTPNPTTASEAGSPSSTLTLGQRAEATLNAATVLPTVVVVPDVWSYIEAVAHWTPKLRYPVLIDDGSPRSAENIGRFVRAYAPTTVMRWKFEAAEPLRGGSRDQARVNSAVARAWGVEGTEEREVIEIGPVLSRWQDIGHEPTGVILANPLDQAWTAALALSAARGQPIMWMELDRNVNAVLTLDEAKALSSRIEAFCTANALRWAKLGDTIDAVTICANAPSRMLFAISPGEGGKEGERIHFALTDYIGRHLPARGMEGRWGWAGQIHGDGAEAAYRAMCGLFVRPRSAWVFDSYTEPGVWQAHDGAAAKQALERAGWSVRLDDAPDATDVQWRGGASRPIDPGLILVTTMGNADFFDLGQNNRCYPGDLPMLDRPAMLHFVHSWSLSSPGTARTIGARWFERGVYAYAGSVQEPFLAAFVPTPDVAARVSSGVPWGQAVRVEGGTVWRIAVFGDPLITAGPTSALKRGDGALPLKGARDLDAELKSAVREKDFASALRLMAMLARDEDATRLVGALVGSPDTTLSPEAAAFAIGPAFRTGELGLVISVQQRMAGAEAKEPRATDLVWNMSRAKLNGLEKDARDRTLDALRVSVRAEQIGPDGAELARWLRVYRGRADAAAFAATIEPQLKAARDKRDLSRAVEGR